MIFVDGVYLTDGADPPVFRQVSVPGTTELQALVQHIAERIGRMLEKRGLIERDCENAWLSSDMVPAGPLDDLVGHSIAQMLAHLDRRSGATEPELALLAARAPPVPSALR